MSTITTRLATFDDLPTLLAFEQGVISAERPLADNLRSGDITYYDLPALIEQNNSHLIIVESNGKPVGSGYMKILPSPKHHKYDNHGYIGFMYVDPDYRGRGLSKTIIDELCHWGKSQGVIEVILEVYDKNVQAIRAYEKSGFKKSLVSMRVEI
ncbi:GNAT family N-acetyltransferase [Thalassotalea euphylliae]|uniref:GNAT family N-acetyltransferase n=1 Tax=Thalassotalea euphylliae TaxID=1655234 RepID=UPI0036388934